MTLTPEREERIRRLNCHGDMAWVIPELLAEIDALRAVLKRAARKAEEDYENLFAKWKGLFQDNEMLQKAHIRCLERERRYLDTIDIFHKRVNHLRENLKSIAFEENETNWDATEGRRRIFQSARESLFHDDEMEKNK